MPVRDPVLQENTNRLTTMPSPVLPDMDRLEFHAHMQIVESWKGQRAHSRKCDCVN